MSTKPHYYQAVREPRPALDWRAGLTQIAFGLALAVAAARCMLLQTTRDPFDVAIGSTSIPHGAGADTAVILDLLCCLPAILVLARRAVDKTYTLRNSLSFLLLLPLVGWLCASFKWADDKFAALISICDFVAAMALLWAMAQIVRSWMRLRIVASIAFGLLLVFLVCGFYYKFATMPLLLEQQAKILRQTGFDAHSYNGVMFAQKISELMGFNSSANSFAGLIIVFMTIGLGVALQRIKDRDDPAWTVALVLSAPLAIWLLFYTKTKAAMVMPVFVIAILAVLWQWRGAIARQSKRAFWIGLAIIFLMILAVVGHGLAHHSLPTSSLNFRWRYLVASWTMFWRHPIHGVGWDNFGIHYIRDRLPAASEEIRDPHDFLVRFFVELGAVGGVLVIAWLMRLWWELTRPQSPPAAVSPLAKTPQMGQVGFVASIALAAILINIWASVDFAQDPNGLFIALVNCLLYLCALLLGSLVVSLRSLEVPQIDQRAAPWILYGILTALGVFLIHNLIEFSLFEPGPLCLFGVLAGSCLGLRLENPPVRTPSTSPVAIAALNVACIVWIGAFFYIAIPIHRAEAAAHVGDDKLRAGDAIAAADKYGYAFTLVPYNAEYAFRAGRALHFSLGGQRQPGPFIVPDQIERAIKLRKQILTWYALAIDCNPSMLAAYHLRAIFELQENEPLSMIADWDKVMALNPNEVSLRLEYARALEALAMTAEARDQYELALKYNDQLDPAEPKRLSADELAKINSEIAALR